MRPLSGKAISLYSEKLRELVRTAHEKAEAITAERAKPQDFVGGTTALNNTLEIYDALFICYNDAISIVKQDLKAETADSSQLHLILNYLSVMLLDFTLQRNLYLVEAYTVRYAARGKEKAGKKSKEICPSDIVRLYDILLQNLQEVLSIPGIEDDDDLGPKYEGQKLLYRATRLFWKAEAFSRATQYAHAVACLSEASQLISDCFQFHRSRKLDTTETEAIATKIRANKCIVQGRAYLLNHQQGERLAEDTADLSLQEDKPGRQVVNSLDNYSDCSELISVPLEFQCMGCKPMFYDVAANYIHEKDISHRMPVVVEPKKKKQKAEAPPPKTEQKTETPDKPAPLEKKSTGGWLSSFWSSS